MKTYNLHVTSNRGEFHLSFTASDNEVNQSHWAFSAVCSNLISGFGDAKATKLYRAMEETEKSGKGSMEYKYQGDQIKIMVDAQ